ncbi:M28 family metallopeptidase [Clostridium vincentii]|uniref:Bacterial leucyl aminopeptidase n=1 Tax=Clostridium vincentii TaxID=52704 RepID=A0A2T0BH14_9CLOT|nr:M28 family metallopeptidase [Clostridium vincentii]PRR83127.1 Bacterial leucyl aminopeptidase precursor [Clostridium vincentii]
MKKSLYLVFTMLSLLGLVTSLFLKSSYYEFNSSNVKNNIEYLSSNDFKGRLAGSEENEKVATEIASTFKEYKLAPLGEDFKENFTVMVPTPNGNECSLRLLNGSSVVKKFILGTDFKEDLLNFNESSISFSKEDKIDIYPTSFSIFKDNIEYVFKVSFDKTFSFRSSFNENSSFGFLIQINTSTFSEILNSIREGNTLDVKLPYAVEPKKISNVTAVIKGSDSNLSPLILTSHFDHIGTDSLDNIYYGALDNASGVSFMLEVCRSFSTLKIPKRDIIFVALNGEELGLQGSREFASKYEDSLEGAQVINLDMIGANNTPITFMSGLNCENKPSDLLKSLEEICSDNDISYVESYKNSSDHASFIYCGFDSLTISHSDLSNIHSPKDTSEKISISSIDIAYSLVEDKIINHAYSSIILILYKSQTIILFSILSFILIGYYFYRVPLDDIQLKK